jgi:Putative peptidoglycan-binding domain-containing protein
MDSGSSYYSKGGKYYGKCTNTNSISIEMCDTQKDGKHNVSTKTRKNTIDLVVYLSKKYNIPRKNVIRHFDVNHKLCPIYYVTNEDAWNKFLDDAFGKITKETKSTKPPIANPILRVGSKGTQVKYLQRDLNYLFKDDISVDGDFGNATKEALKKFQKKYKLTQDGIYGLKSRTKMAEAIKEK